MNFCFLEEEAMKHSEIDFFDLEVGNKFSLRFPTSRTQISFCLCMCVCVCVCMYAFSFSDDNSTLRSNCRLKIYQYLPFMTRKSWLIFGGDWLPWKKVMAKIRFSRKRDPRPYFPDFSKLSTNFSIKILPDLLRC